jgi:hypothetical protein
MKVRCFGKRRSGSRRYGAHKTIWQGSQKEWGMNNERLEVENPESDWD